MGKMDFWQNYGKSFAKNEKRTHWIPVKSLI
jgi:hypothetical protein